jgi:hypothetical protein
MFGQEEGGEAANPHPHHYGFPVQAWVLHFSVLAPRLSLASFWGEVRMGAAHSKRNGWEGFWSICTPLLMG